MDPYLLNSMGLAAEDDPLLGLPPLVKQRALAANVRAPNSTPPMDREPLTAMPTQGVRAPRPAPQQAAPPEQAAPAPAAAARPDYRQKAFDIAQQANEAATTMPDMSGQVQRYRQGYEAAGPDMGLAMFLSGVGGRMGQEMGGQVFKQALARRAPQTTPYGTLDYEGGFTADPLKDREFKVQRLERQAALFESMANHAETIEERVRANKAAEQARADAQRMHQENLREARALRAQSAAQGRFAHFKDAEGNDVLYNTRTGEIQPQRGGAPGGAPGAPGAPGQFPSRVNPKATEDERRIASQVQRIVGSAGLMTQEGAAPGAIEAAAGQLPGIGSGAAAAVRGASGTMGIGEKTRQTTYQSQADVIDALLYISTGAAYNKEQLETMREAYMPAFTDNEISKRDKRQRLLGMIEAAKVRAGRAWTQDAENALQKVLPSLTGSGADAPTTRTKLPRTQGERDANEYLKRVEGLRG